MAEQVEMHENCDCIIVNPTGQIQNIKECWCKAYHAFGQNFQFEQVVSYHMTEDIHCYVLKPEHAQNLTSNGFLERKLNRKVQGAGILYRKGDDISLEKAKTILTQ